MTDPKRTVMVVIEQSLPIPTGEECPRCGFDSIVASLFLVNNRPSFTYLCGRRDVCDFVWWRP
ncbi:MULTISPECIES: hypothetical protein [unclassified Microbacterium]|uniref:hypothetical protein n=1 Tax=unclassified Microbacterium TaxID=2609290 RepID=UPI00386A1308